MTELSWGDADAAIWGLMVVALLFAYVGRALWRRSVLSILEERGPLSRLVLQSPLWLRGVRVALVLGAATLLVVALMRPQHGSRATEVKHLGVDIAVVLDASKSMKAPDVIPDRLEAAKLEIRRMLDQLHGGRVSLVPFAGLSFVQTPLTSDVEVVKTYLNDLRVEDMPRGGTAIGRAMLEGIRALVPASQLQGTPAEEPGADRADRDQELTEL
ncbi:MAG: VWA domain-containing protein [Myxococcota bacterium]|nr:VWA domain-containing protein [Myxococcota bacterium]